MKILSKVHRVTLIRSGLGRSVQCFVLVEVSLSSFSNKVSWQPFGSAEFTCIIQQRDFFDVGTVVNYKLLAPF